MFQFNAAQTQKLSEGGEDLLDRVLDQARILTAYELLGMARQAIDTTLTCLKQHVRAKQVLATFQALQHRMADLFAELTQMRSAAKGRLQALDSGVGIERAATLAKVEANRVLRLVSNEGIQLYGGIGMTDEYDVSLLLNRARGLEASLGKTSFMRDRYGTLGMY